MLIFNVCAERQTGNYERHQKWFNMSAMVHTRSLQVLCNDLICKRSHLLSNFTRVPEKCRLSGFFLLERKHSTHLINFT